MLLRSAGECFPSGVRMSRGLVFLCALFFSTFADAFVEVFVERTEYLKGVTVTAVKHAAHASCRVDFVIRVSDGDQHLVKIDYDYSGGFTTYTGTTSGYQTQARSDIINVTVGRNTLNGNFTRVYTTTAGGRTCTDWDAKYHFVASEYNASQDQRGHQDQLRQEEQARLNEIKRREEEALANKRRVEQQQRDFKASQEKMKMDKLEAYRRASPENARCIINEPADITRCEQWKAQEKAAQLQRDAAVARMHEIETAKHGLEQSSVNATTKAARDMASNNCAYAASLPERIPYPKSNTNNAQYQDEVKRIDALNWEAQQKFHRDVKAANDACEASRSRASVQQPNQQQYRQQQQEALRIQAEQQQRYEARQRALGDLEVQVQRGQQTVNEAAGNTRSMQNDNANLQDMINRMK